MNEIMRRRRALMANPWHDITALYPISAFVPSGDGVRANLENNVLTVTTNSNGSYRNAVILNFETDIAYSYRIKCHISPVGGECRLTCRTTEGATVAGTSTGAITEDKDIDLIFNGNQNIAQLTFFITWSSSRSGQGIISNWSIKRRLL